MGKVKTPRARRGEIIEEAPLRKSAGWSGVAETLLLISCLGAINWGLVGLFDYDVVERLFASEGVVRAVYMLVGLCGLLGLMMLPLVRILRRDRSALTRREVRTTATPRHPTQATTPPYGRGYDDRADLRP